MEDRFDRALRRFFMVVTVGLAVALIAAGVVIWLLVVRVENVTARVEKVTAAEAANLERHRQRNEVVHGCQVHKYDALRLDIYNLFQTPPGAKPAFPASDGISCPPIQP